MLSAALAAGVAASAIVQFAALEYKPISVSFLLTCFWESWTGLGWVEVEWVGRGAVGVELCANAENRFTGGETQNRIQRVIGRIVATLIRIISMGRSLVRRFGIEEEEEGRWFGSGLSWAEVIGYSALRVGLVDSIVVNVLSLYIPFIGQEKQECLVWISMIELAGDVLDQF